MRFLLLPLALLPLLAACGDDKGTGTVRGTVNDTTRRICVIDDENQRAPAGDRSARCFQARAEVLSAYRTGDCVTLDYASRGDARLAEATEVEPTEGCASPATGR